MLSAIRRSSSAGRERVDMDSGPDVPPVRRLPSRGRPTLTQKGEEAGGPRSQCPLTRDRAHLPGPCLWAGHVVQGMWVGPDWAGHWVGPDGAGHWVGPDWAGHVGGA